MSTFRIQIPQKIKMDNIANSGIWKNPGNYLKICLNLFQQILKSNIIFYFLKYCIILIIIEVQKYEVEEKNNESRPLSL